MKHYVSLCTALFSLALVSLHGDDSTAAAPPMEAPLAKPTSKDYKRFASSLTHSLTKSFEPQDLIFLAQKAAALLDQEFKLTLAEKRKGVIKTLNIIVDKTDTPYMPDYFFDPLFKEMIPCFVKVMVHDTSFVDASTPISGEPTASASGDFAKELSDSLNGKLHVAKLPAHIETIVAEASRYKDLSAEDRLLFAKSIYNAFIEETDTASLPDALADPILKKLGTWMLKELIQP